MIDKFIQEVILLLENENEGREYYKKSKIDIPFKISVLEQHLSNEKYHEFVQDISDNTYQLYFEWDNDDYNYDKLSIDFDDVNYRYIIEFGRNSRYWGYCECDENDEGYDHRYNCCGYGCDWDAPEFTITKEISLGTDSFKGYQRDLWEYEDRYYNVTVKEKEEQVRISKIKNLIDEKNRIEEELNKLRNIS